MYWISGGGKPLPGWRAAGLARKDLIHLTPEGYSLKGRHLAHALRGTLAWLDAHPEAQSLVLNREPLRQTLLTVPAEADEDTDEDAGLALASVYTVQRGECLAGIAKRNGVTTSQLMRWNRMKTRRVHPGTKLEIRTGKK